MGLPVNVVDGQMKIKVGAERKRKIALAGRKELRWEFSKERTLSLVTLFSCGTLLGKYEAKL